MDRTNMRFSRWHLLWVFAVPVWQLLDMLRHEGGHALAALLTGAPEHSLHLQAPKLGFPWFSGHVWMGTPTTWITSGAPFVFDLVVLGVALCVLRRTRLGTMPSIAINVFALGVAGPFLLTSWRYAVSLANPETTGDIGRLWGTLPRSIVDGFFIAAILVYAIGVFVILRSWLGWRCPARRGAPSNSAQEPTEPRPCAPCDARVERGEVSAAQGSGRCTDQRSST